MWVWLLAVLTCCLMPPCALPGLDWLAQVVLAWGATKLSGTGCRGWHPGLSLLTVRAASCGAGA